MDHQRKVYYRYIPIGDMDNVSGLYLTCAGYTAVPPDSPYPVSPHPSDYQFNWNKGRTLDEYQFIYITKGRGVFEAKPGGSYKIQPGSLFILFPGVWHHYRPEKKIGWDEYWFAVKGEIIDRLVEKKFFSPAQCVLNIGLDDALIEHFMCITNVIKEEFIGYQQVAAAHAMQAMAAVLARLRARQLGSNSREEIVRKAKFVMAENLDANLDMEKLAKKLHISYVHFRQIFKQHTGLAPHQYYLILRVNRAKELLKGSDLPIKQIAAMLGFGDQYYFSKFFRQKIHMSPSDWRNM